VLIKYHADMLNKIALAADVPEDLAGHRIDQVAAKMFPEYSRARLQAWIKSGMLRVDGQSLRVKDKVFAGARVRINAELAIEEAWQPESLPVDIHFEDDALLVINKKINTVVHPAAGNYSGTLLNGLLHYCPALKLLPRAGIVHRLDKDTTGLMVVAKTLESQTRLVKQLQKRRFLREYEAVVQGVLTAGGVIDLPLGRHPHQRRKRAVVENGQEAVTHYTVIKRFRAHTHVRVRLETGRTHQIRVHLSHTGYPIVGDRVYAGRARIPRGSTEVLLQTLHNFPRQALHARSLGLEHPVSGDSMVWESELPSDMQDLLSALEADTQCQ
jgi:23S rRNA pseudouridine1911/1915/1917 synthase